MYTIETYVTAEGKDIYREWHRKLRDFKAKDAADRRLMRMELGNFGDHKFCREGVWELRIDVGAGYRIYYGMMEAEIVVLLCGGDKYSQSFDIDRAVVYWKSLQEVKDAHKQKP